MSTTTLIVTVVIAVVVILVLRALAGSKPQNPLAEFEAGQQTSPTAPDVRHVAQLLLEGKKIEAIKAYMEVARVGLEEAKNAVERYDPLLKKFELSSPPSFETITDCTEIDELLENGDKIAAIKLYRAKTGCDLKEAKDAIDIRDNPS